MYLLKIIQQHIFHRICTIIIREGVKLMNKKFYALFAILILVFVAIPTFADHSWGVRRGRNIRAYHWERTSNPVSLNIGDNMSGTWDAHLDTAIADWNLSSVLSLTKVLGNTTGSVCATTVGAIEACNAAYGTTGWLGIAGISISSGHITSGYAKMNDTYFDSPDYNYNTPEWRLFVTCQEIGHLFGLDHQDETFDNANLNTCMDYTSSPDPNQHPNQHDYDQLEDIYGHLDGDGGGDDGSTPCRGGPKKCPNGNGINGFTGGNSPSDWGQLVRQNGRVAVYERDFGNGNRELTIVIWAD